MTQREIAANGFWLLLLLALTAACTPTPGARLAGTDWTLIELDGRPPIEGREATIRFEKATVEGSTGCNRYGGSYVVASDGGLALTGLFATEMACIEPQGIMAQEAAYRAALAAVAAYRVEGDRLDLLDKGGGVMLAFIAVND